MNPNLEKIPPELRELPQWVCSGPDKVPINPRTGKVADPADPSTGGSFVEAVNSGMQNIGFILGENDPFTIIDLDDPFSRKDKSPIREFDPDFGEALQIAKRHSKIYNAFANTYAELSQSGKGIHIVMRASIPRGVRRDKVELYSSLRYMIFTGRVLRNLPVTDCQDLTTKLFLEIGNAVDETGDLLEEDALCEDSAIWKMATRAENAEKFIALCSGNLAGFNYESQSEADFALLSMLCFYTRSNEQVRRMFRETALGQRTKAVKNDVYINRSLKRIRLRELPIIDFSKISLNPPPPLPPPPPALIVGTNGETYPPLPPGPSPAREINPFGKYTFPPGLVGQVAEYIFSSAIRPVQEVALCAAIALCAGIGGRSYNISGLGLNQYIILIAETGRGKEGAATGIDNLMGAVKQSGIPMADRFLGPAAFASGQALVKVLDSSNCFVSVLGEFGITLKQICDPKAPGPLEVLKKVLLDVYTKSGFGKVLRSSVYSDTEKNTKIVQAPNLTLLGESTPDRFFNGLDLSHIADGLIPRFSIVEYKGKRPPKNQNAFHLPPDELVKELGAFITIALTTGQNNTVCPVRVDADAKAILDLLDKDSDARINDTGSDIEAELWNRADLKGMKLAGLIAAGCNPHAPVITAEIAKWAVSFVRREIWGVMERFRNGDIGTGEAKQEAEIRRLFLHFQTMTHDKRKAYRCPEELLAVPVVPYQYLNQYTRRLACFKADRRGECRALKETLENMVRAEVFEMVPLQQLTSQFKTRSPIYLPGPAW